MRLPRSLSLRLPRSDVGVALLLAAVALVVYLVLIVGHRTQFDYFGRLAYAISRGQIWLDGAPLSELDPGRNGHFYNVQPPLPALLLLPLVPFGPSAQIETFLSACIGALVAAPQFLALRGLGAPRALAILCTLFVVFGTTLWPTATDGRSWFGANAEGTFFATMALWLAASRRSVLGIGLMVGAAALARPLVGLALPGLLLLRYRDETSLRWVPRAALVALAGVAPFAAFQAWYDWARWGDFFSLYGPQARVFAEGTYSRGRLSLSYVPRHLYAILFSAPAFSDNDLFFLRPRAVGMAVLLSSPAFLWLALALGRLREHVAWRALALCALAVALPSWLVAPTGADQFGYRYGLDYQPFLVALLAVGAGRRDGRWVAPSGAFVAAVIASIVLTSYFVITIKRFGLAG